MSLASLFLLAVIALMLLVDYAKFGRGAKRLVLVEGLLFSAAGLLVAFPNLAVAFAHRVGIGRGVDVVLYLAIIWLLRESIHSRYGRWKETERLTRLVRTLAIESARRRAPGD